MSPFAKLLLQALQAAPSADNSQPYTAEWDGQTLNIYYDTPRVSGHTFPADNPATLISLGGITENLNQLCNHLGTTFELNYLFEQSDISARLTVTEPPNLPVSIDQLSIFKRHTNRFGYRKQPIHSDILNALELSNAGSARIGIVTEKSHKHNIRRLVKSASEIRFQTREVHEWLGKSLRFSPQEIATGEGLDINTLDLPPGGSLFMKFIASWQRMNLLNKLGAYKLLATIDSAPIQQAPAVITISAPAAPQGAIDAGRAMVQVWSKINAQGLATHPYYVISDQLVRLREGTAPKPLTSQAQQLADDSRNIFSLDGEETLYMLLRVGHPKREAPRSLRLPMETVFKDLTQTKP